MNFLQQARRRVVRAPVNPMDKSTVVSIFPKDIVEVKCTIEPGTFKISRGTYANPSTLVVGPSSWWRELDEEQPMLEIPVSSIQIADAIVKDYCNGILACNMGDKMPGLFYIPGEVSLDEVKNKHIAQLNRVNTNQRNWYEELIKLGDILWARTNGNPLSISDDMRMAAREMKIEGKLWMKDAASYKMRPCPACGNLRNEDYPICSSCKTVIDKKKYDDMGLKQAV